MAMALRALLCGALKAPDPHLCVNSILIPSAHRPISSAHYSLSLTSPNKNTLLIFLLLESSHIAFFQGRKTSHPNNGTTYKTVIAQEKKSSSVRNI